MKIIIIILTIIGFSFTVPAKDRIQIRIPTVEEETTYVWRTICDIQFFEEHNYKVSLPNGNLIETLKQKSKTNSLTDKDFELLLAHMKSSVYKKGEYEKGFKNIATNKVLINKMINEFFGIEKDWKFKEFEKYIIKLTLYGPGGSCDSKSGIITLYTTKEGLYKQYKNPANTSFTKLFISKTKNV